MFGAFMQIRSDTIRVTREEKKRKEKKQILTKYTKPQIYLVWFIVVLFHSKANNEKKAKHRFT